MKSYTDLRTMHSDLTNNTDANNLTFGSRAHNDSIRQICAMSPFWDFLEASTTDTTVASQNNYDIPYNSDKIVAVVVTNGSTNYPLLEVTSRQEWNHLQYVTYTSDIPDRFYVYNDELLLWPTPASSGDTITIDYKKRVRDLQNADYTTGTITATNGDETITGSGTTFTAAMVGRYLKVDADNYWYEIASFTSATEIELVKKFKGTTASGAAYTIGEMPILPENYHDVPGYYGAFQFWLQQKDSSLANQYKQLYLDGVANLKRDHINKTVDVTVDTLDDEYPLNPNLFPRA